MISASRQTLAGCLDSLSGACKEYCGAAAGASLSRYARVCNAGSASEICVSFENPLSHRGLISSVGRLYPVRG